jgi:hypothetical protein
VSERRNLTASFGRGKVDVLASSGMLRITVKPERRAGLVALVFDVFFFFILYHYWSVGTLFNRVFWIFLLVSMFVGLTYVLLGEENIEINSRTLTIRKGIHGWERQREYQITECRNLRWRQGQKGGGSYLKCEVGRWPITFGNRVSEDDSIKILSALQTALPDVARQICASPASKEHFITLGLNKK